MFLVGAGIGGLVIALTHGSSSEPVAVKHPAPRAPAFTLPGGSHTGRHRPAHRTHHRPAAPAPASGTSVTTPDAAASFAALQSRLAGESGIAFAPLAGGPIQSLGNFQTAHAWSTMKVPVLATLLLDYEHNGGVLDAAGHTDAALALEQSDNAAAEALFGRLETMHGGLDGASTAVQRTLEQAGDSTTQINTAPNSQGFTTWGQSEWSASDEVAFYRALAQGCLLGPHDTAYVLGLMSRVSPSQRWGAGAAGYPTTTYLGFKAGWGPENGGGYLVRQTAIVGRGSSGYVVSMLALPGNGSFDSGISMVSSLAGWARAHLVLDNGAAESRCTTSPISP